MAITRTAWTDDDGSGTSGTVINNAVKTELYDQIDAVVAGVGSIIGGTGSNQTIAASTTKYLAFFADNPTYYVDSSTPAFVVPRAGVLSKLYVNVISQPGTGSLVWTVFKNGSATALTVTVAASASGIFSDLTHTVSVVAGDYVCLQVVNNASGNSGNIRGFGMSFAG